MRKMCSLVLGALLIVGSMAVAPGAFGAVRSSQTVFADGFESGDLSQWMTTRNMFVESATVHSGSWAAEANVSSSSGYALKYLSPSVTELVYETWFQVKSQGTNPLNLLRLRDPGGSNLLTLFVGTDAHLDINNAIAGTTTSSPVVVDQAIWHKADLHVVIAGATSQIEVTLDDSQVGQLSGSASLGTDPIGQLVLGDNVANRTYDVIFDDVTANVPGDSQAPTPPGNLFTAPVGGSEVDLTWSPSSDDGGVIAYDVYRDGVQVGSVGGDRTTFGDSSVSPSTAYTYTVMARDGAGHTSDPSNDASVTTPAPRTGVVANDSAAWQTNGTVWALAYANGAIYVGGEFTSVRPPGAAAGQNEVPRDHIAAFDANTGDLLPFGPDVDQTVYALAASPDGSRVYAGGDFSTVNGHAHARLAAFDTASGSLIGSWNPSGNARVLALATFGSAVYIGGVFTTLNGANRQHVGAVSDSGTILPWRPSTDKTVAALAVAQDGSRVFVGGYFDMLDNQPFHAIGSVDPASGTLEPWAATVVPSCSVVKVIRTDDNSVYVGGEGGGIGCFDGTFAANPADGTLKWFSDCLGATQALAIIADNLYVGSHAHDCSTVPGGFPQVTSGDAYHLERESTSDGYNSEKAWFPATNGNPLGPRVMATDGTHLSVGGDFTYVNHHPQQGFAMFGSTPDTTVPVKPAAPILTSTAAGVVSVSWPATTDLDDADLAYRLFRDNSPTPIAVLAAHSVPWTTPSIRFRDVGLAPGSTHTYHVRATDGGNTSFRSPESSPITVASSDPAGSYSSTVLADSPLFYWRLGEAGGTTAADATGNHHDGVYESGYTQGRPGAIPADPDTAVSLDGQTGLISSSEQFNNPQTFSIEAWFKTTTLMGGRLIGFGTSQTGASTSYDRHVFMMASGQLKFGVYTNRAIMITSPRAYNDGWWHHLVATLGGSGMALYVDGALVASATNTAAQNYKGYWRVGYDNLRGWTPWPGGNPPSNMLSSPPSYFFHGTVDEVAVYSAALTAQQVSRHYAANVLNH